MQSTYTTQECAGRFDRSGSNPHQDSNWLALGRDNQILFARGLQLLPRWLLLQLTD
jgi:hypothetical protein